MPGIKQELFNKFSARKHSSRIGNFPSIREECTLPTLFHNASIPVHSWTKSVIDQIRHHGDGMYSHALSNN